MYNNIAPTGPYANRPDTITLTLPGHVHIRYSMRTGKDNGNCAGVAGSSGDGTASTGGVSKGSTSGVCGLTGLDVNDTELSTTNHGTNVPTPSNIATITTSNKNNLPTSTNHIHFFKYGEAMDHFIVS
eukprot:28230-Ditylum_brightwellii.AAC.1